MFETGAASEDDELFHFGPHELWLNLRTVPLRDEHGHVTSLMGVCRNITERKRAEQALKQTRDALERQVEDRTAELREANARLQREHRTLRHLLQSSDHERQLIAYEIHQSPKVRVELVQQGDWVRIEVLDQGVGFKPEDIEEDHFGVAGIRERARLLGGSALIESEPGQGTRIVMELPVVPREEEAK